MRFNGLSIVLLLIFAVLTGCTLNVPLEDLLSPPKLTDEQLEIYNAMMKGKSGGITLKYPKGGDYRSAFVVADFADNDEDKTNNEAAIVFYEMSDITTERTLWLNFLDKDENGDWQSVYDLSIKGTDINRVSFFSLGDDPGTSIMVSYSLNQTEKAFVLIKYKDRVPVKVMEGPYSYMSRGEFLDRGTEELMIIRNDYTLETAQASFYTWSEERFMLTGTCELDPTAGEYTGITQGKLNDDMTALFINHRKYGNRDNYGTDVVYIENGKFHNYILQDNENLERVLRRTNNYTEPANPMDINGDGSIELCSSAGEFPGYGASAQTDKLRPVIWWNPIENRLAEMYYSYYSGKNNFVFFFPNRWKNSVTVKLSADGRRVSFFEAATAIGDASKELLSISVVSFGSAEPSGDGWSLYDASATMSLEYYIKIPNPNDPLTLTEDELAEGFKIISRFSDAADIKQNTVDGGVLK